MKDASTTALDWKEIDVRLGEVEPEIAREVLLDLLTDDISPVIALSRLLLALGGAQETEELLAAVARRWGRPLDRRLREMAVLLHDHREGCDRVADMLREHPDPLRVSGSDGVDHLEYDLVVTNAFVAPVTLTSIAVTAPDGETLLRLDGDGSD